jgi:hypothetical protein
LHGAIYPTTTVTGSTDGGSRSDTDHSLSYPGKPHPAAQLQLSMKRKEMIMNDNNRVLSRRNARELTPAEVDHVTGSINTLTICSTTPKTGTTDCDTVG